METGDALQPLHMWRTITVWPAGGVIIHCVCFNFLVRSENFRLIRVHSSCFPVWKPVSGKLGHIPKLVGEGDIPLDMVPCLIKIIDISNISG